MKILILGWYGTETLGDRAILDGIFRIFERIEKDNIYTVASLYPLLTERTFYEDMPLYRTYTSNAIFNIIDVKTEKDLKDNINKSDIVLMGGGPLMDIDQMYIIKFAFKFAKSIRKKTVLMGCGYGPLKRKDIINNLQEIINNANLAIMRTNNCKRMLIENIVCDTCKVEAFCDPALLSVMSFKENNPVLEQEPYWVINLRNLDYVYNSRFYDRTLEFVENISNQVEKLLLLPNHTFCVGGDDRYLNSKIKIDLKTNKIDNILKPKSLMETYRIIQKAQGCIGMRYHAILFQTFLNGNNYIIDYTDSDNGKIISFVRDIDKGNFYKDRYKNIFKDSWDLYLTNDKNFIIDPNTVKENLKKYVATIKNLLELN